MVSESPHEVEEGAQDGQPQQRITLPHDLRPPLPVRASSEPVRAFGHIGRVLARRARSTRCPVSRDVRRAEFLSDLHFLIINACA